MPSNNAMNFAKGKNGEQLIKTNDGYLQMAGRQGWIPYSGQAFTRAPDGVMTPIAGSAPTPAEPPPPLVNPASSFTYRPANQYSQYYSPLTNGGMYGRQPLQPYMPPVQGSTAHPTASSLIASLGRAAPVGAMAQGGPVRGQGGGQEDAIITTSRPKNFIIPADVVADIGDGSSNEGHNRLLQTWSRMGFNVSPRGFAKGGSVPVALSQDEHEVPAEVVSALGRGSNARGTDMLDTMIRKVREHKAKKGFPPPAKSPLAYMGKR